MTNTEELRRCSDCRCTSPLEINFSKNKNDTYYKTCDKCRRKREEYRKTPEYKTKRTIYSKKRNENPEIKEKMRINSARHYQENKEIIRTRHREYYQENKEKMNELSKKWYSENKEDHIKRGKEWSINNKEKHKQLKKEWRINNKERVNKYARDKRATDPSFKILLNLRNRINKAVKHGRRSAKTMDLIGCTIEELKQHLEGKFEDGMSFDNYGEWHIDHITPCIAFNLLDPEEQRKCFNWKNLQPLWAKDNMSKGGKLDWIKKK